MNQVSEKQYQRSPEQLSSKLEILYYTPYFRETLTEAGGFAPSLAEDLCTITLDRDRIAAADAVLFHIPNMKGPPPVTKRPGQIWVAMSMESDANYPLQCNTQFMQHFDICMNFRRTADVPVLYFDPGDLSALQTPPKRKYRQAPAVYFASNNRAHNNRYQLVEELMKYMKVDSYGKSQNNCKVENDTGCVTKLDVISGYMFNFAFENSNSVDYVSEKMFDGLIAGTVPVYLGAPNIDDYLPAKKCIIKVSDFPDPKDLAQYLIALSQDEHEYDSYLAWKNEPLEQSFLKLVEPENIPPLRRLCTKISELLENALR